MRNPIKAIREWNIRRVERNYQEVISRYSSEDYEIIMAGRNVKLTAKTIEKLVEENPDKKVVPLTRPGHLYSFFNTPVSRRKHLPLPYSVTTFGCRQYDEDVKYWLEIGRLGAEALCSCACVPAHLGDSNVTWFNVGIPVKFVDKK